MKNDETCRLALFVGIVLGFAACGLTYAVYGPAMPVCERME